MKKMLVAFLFASTAMFSCNSETSLTEEVVVEVVDSVVTAVDTVCVTVDTTVVAE